MGFASREIPVGNCLRPTASWIGGERLLPERGGRWEILHPIHRLPSDRLVGAGHDPRPRYLVRGDARKVS